jgi:hypothetical protein
LLLLLGYPAGKVCFLMVHGCLWVLYKRKSAPKERRGATQQRYDCTESINLTARMWADSRPLPRSWL